MYSLPELIKKIREEADLTQAELAEAVGVSTVLITMVETRQKNVSKELLKKLAKLLNVHPASITPFLFFDEANSITKFSKAEKLLIGWGEKMQEYLIRKRALTLKKYAKH